MLFFGGHVAGGDDAVAFAVGPEDAEDAASGEGFAEGKITGVAGVDAFAVGQKF